MMRKYFVKASNISLCKLCLLNIVLTVIIRQFGGRDSVAVMMARSSYIYCNFEVRKCIFSLSLA